MVAPQEGLIAMQNVGDGATVMHFGGDCRCRIDDLFPAVNTTMRLQAKVPLNALLGLMHLRLALAVLVLGRRWSRPLRYPRQA